MIAPDLMRRVAEAFGDDAPAVMAIVRAARLSDTEITRGFEQALAAGPEAIARFRAALLAFVEGN